MNNLLELTIKLDRERKMWQEQQLALCSLYDHGDLTKLPFHEVDQKNDCQLLKGNMFHCSAKCWTSEKKELCCIHAVTITPKVFAMNIGETCTMNLFKAVPTCLYWYRTAEINVPLLFLWSLSTLAIREVTQMRNIVFYLSGRKNCLRKQQNHVWDVCLTNT